MAVRIITDSSSDLSFEVAEKYGIEIVPLTVNFENGHYRDRFEISPEEFYAKLKKEKNLPSTSQVTKPAFLDVFNRVLEEGDQVVGIFISSKLSGTFSSAVTAGEEIGSEDVFVVDSENVSGGLALLAVVAAEMAAEGKSAADITAAIERDKKKVRGVLSLDTLEYMKKGGRLSAGQALFGTVLNVKPVIKIEEGLLLPLDKVRGRSRLKKWFNDWIKENGFSLSGKKVFFVHSDDPDGLAGIIGEIEKENSIGEKFIEKIGTTVGTHVGPGCNGMFFLEG